MNSTTMTSSGTAIDHRRVLRGAEFGLGIDKNGSLKIAAGELNPYYYNHILTLLSTLWLASEKKVDIKVIAGPIICVEGKKQTMIIPGVDTIFIEVLKNWLKPAIDHVSLKFEEGFDYFQLGAVKKLVWDRFLKLEGTEVEIKSIRYILQNGRLFGKYHRQRQASDNFSISEERKKYWLEKITNGPNAELYDGLYQQYSQKLVEVWIFGVWPLFAGYDGSYPFLWAKMIMEYAGSGKLLARLISKYKIEQEMRRIKELEKGLFALPQNKADLLRNCNTILLRAGKERNGNPDWRGKICPIGPFYFWKEVYYQKLVSDLKKARAIIQGLNLA